MIAYSFYCQGPPGTWATSEEIDLPNDEVARDRAAMMLSGADDVREIVVWCENRFVAHLTAPPDREES